MKKMKKEQFDYVMLLCKILVEKLVKSKHNSACICGSSKFCDLIAVVKWELEKKGIMATGLHLLPDWYTKHSKWKENHHGAEQEGVEVTLDNLHIDKINKYDCVIVVNPNKYIGERTAIEIKYAKNTKKQVIYWETE